MNIISTLLGSVVGESPTKKQESDSLIGKPISRVEGKLKVTGQADYSSDIEFVNLAHACLVQSTIAAGRIASIDTSAAKNAPGVLAVITHENAAKLNKVGFPQPGQPRTSAGHMLPVLQDDVVHFSGQHIGIVVADSLSRAEYAANLVKVEYEEQSFKTDFAKATDAAFELLQDPYGRPLQYARGDVDGAFDAAAVKIEATYQTPTHNHNPLAPFASVAVWENEKLTVYDATQSVHNVQLVLAAMLGIPASNVRVVAHYVGGAFGCGLRAWTHIALAAIAAKRVRRPVKLVLSRPEMFTSVGRRAATLQTIKLAATKNGRLTAISHDNISPTSPVDEFVESTTFNSRNLYACANVATTHKLVRVNAPTPTYMRGLGESTGMFALESAMDELSYELGIDPIELRLKNFADKDYEKNAPWSSNSLKECFRLGAEKFNWKNRNPQPRSMRDGATLLGIGVASAMYPAQIVPASATARILVGNTAFVQSGATDIGPGTYTANTQIAAENLGLPIDRVRFELGDSNMPNAPLQGGSMLMGSLGSAVQAAANAVKQKIIGVAVSDGNSPLYQVKPEKIEVRNGRMFLRGDEATGEMYGDVLERNQMTMIEAEADANTDAMERMQKFSMYSFGAKFCEVRVTPDIGRIEVSRFLGVYGAGRIINAKLARSQMLGGIIGGIGMALLEETITDENYGRILNANLGEYHVVVNADVYHLEHIFVEEDDAQLNDIRTKGIGEIGIVGAAAAIANAVFHATGVRVCDLPITLEKIL